MEEAGRPDCEGRDFVGQRAAPLLETLLCPPLRRLPGRLAGRPAGCALPFGEPSADSR